MNNDNFVLNSLLSLFLDDFHEIPSDFDVSSLSQREVDFHVNRMRGLCDKTLITEIVDAIIESSEAVMKEEIFDQLKAFLK